MGDMQCYRYFFLLQTEDRGFTIPTNIGRGGHNENCNRQSKCSFSSSMACSLKATVVDVMGMKIGEEDIGTILQSFATAALDPTQWVPAMTSLSHAMGAVGCALELTDLNTGAAYMANSAALDDDLARDYEERIFHINPRIQCALSMPTGQVADDSVLMARETPHKSEFLDWLERSPYFYIIGGKILNKGGHVGFLTANFTKRHGMVEEAHHDVFSILTPQLINIVEVGRALSANRLRHDLIGLEALDTDRCFGLLDRSGRLLECSAGFAAALRARRVLGLRDSRLVAIHASHRAAVDLFLASILGDPRVTNPPLPVRLASPDAPRGVVLRAIPVSPGNHPFSVFGPTALITLTDLDAPVRARRQELANLFSLTEREAEVAALIGEGCTIEQTVKQLAISAYTVRQHLKAVFSKIGVSRQAELVAIVSRLG